MKRNVLEAWILLAFFDYLMRFRGFACIHERVRKQPVLHKQRKASGDQALNHAIDIACVLYFKPVLCLQRSAALTVLLRRHGSDAEMVIGAQLFPFLSHAWVELHGQVLNDKPYITQLFQVMERC